MKDRIIRDIWKLLETEKVKKIKKEIREKKEINDRLSKDRIIRNIKTLLEQQEENDYCKPRKVSCIYYNNHLEFESNGDKNRNLSLN